MELTGIVYLSLLLKTNIAMLKSGVFLLFLCSFISFTSVGQLPASEVYLATLSQNGNELSLTSLTLISDFNPGGYNNQARFFSDDQIYLSVKRPTDGTNDIVKLQLKSKELSWVTQTKEISEFSPIPCPDGNYFTAVRIEKDGKDQSLWKYPLDRSNSGTRLFPELTNVGYYAWINNDSVVLFLVDKPNKLVIGGLSDGKIYDIARNPGRCIRYLANGNVYFVQQLDNGHKWLKSYNIQDQAITSIIQMPGDAEDFEITTEGRILTIDGSQIKTSSLTDTYGWKTIVDLAPYHILKAQRPVLHENRLLFVNNILESKK
jgi:hypothetical protein